MVSEEPTTIARGATEVCLHSIGQSSSLIPDADDDDYDRRQQRRRYEEPLHIKVRKQLLAVAESVRIYSQLQPTHSLKAT